MIENRAQLKLNQVVLFYFLMEKFSSSSVELIIPMNESFFFGNSHHREASLAQLKEFSTHFVGGAGGRKFKDGQRSRMNRMCSYERLERSDRALFLVKQRRLRVTRSERSRKKNL